MLAALQGKSFRNIPASSHAAQAQKNLENNPMQSKADPARSPLAALRPAHEKKRANLVSFRI
jgi:hypothetical protein